MLGSVRDKFCDSLDQVGVVLINTVGKYVNSGGFGWEWHLLWQVIENRGGGEWVGVGVSWKG